MIRSNSPLPRLPTRFMGYFRRSGLFIHLRTDRAFKQGLNDTPPNSGSPSVSLSIQRSVPSTTWHLIGQATKPQWQQLCQTTSPSSGTSLAKTPPAWSAVAVPFSLGAHPNRLDAPPVAATVASAATVDPLTNERLDTPAPLRCSIESVLPLFAYMRISRALAYFAFSASRVLRMFEWKAETQIW